MGSPGEHTDRIEALRSVLDRLCAADLTLSEAKALRPCLAGLLNSTLPNVDRGSATATRDLVSSQDR